MSTDTSPERMSALDSEPDIDTTTNGIRQMGLTDKPTCGYNPVHLTSPTSLYEEPLSDSGSEPDVESDIDFTDKCTGGHDPELTLAHIIAHVPYDDLPAKLFSHNELAYIPPQFVYGIRFRDAAALRELGPKYEPDYLNGLPLDYMALLQAYLSPECKVDESRIKFCATHERKVVLYVASSWENDISFMEEDATKLQQSFQRVGWSAQFKWYLRYDYIKEITDFNLPPFNRQLAASYYSPVFVYFNQCDEIHASECHGQARHS